MICSLPCPTTKSRLSIWSQMKKKDIIGCLRVDWNEKKRNIPSPYNIISSTIKLKLNWYFIQHSVSFRLKRSKKSMKLFFLPNHLLNLAKRKTGCSRFFLYPLPSSKQMLPVNVLMFHCILCSIAWTAAKLILGTQ